MITITCQFSIVGMGGMGKTSLTQHLINDSKMEEEFDIKAWVCISNEFDVFKVTRAILEGITGSTDDTRYLNMVQEKLKEKLTATSFLLVLDDLWNEKVTNGKLYKLLLIMGLKEAKFL